MEAGGLVSDDIVLACVEERLDGDAKAAKTWLNSPNMALSWRAPLKLAEREKGARVEDLIGRLEHGVYS